MIRKPDDINFRLWRRFFGGLVLVGFLSLATVLFVLGYFFLEAEQGRLRLAQTTSEANKMAKELRLYVEDARSFFYWVLDYESNFAPDSVVWPTDLHDLLKRFENDLADSASLERLSLSASNFKALVNKIESWRKELSSLEGLSAEDRPIVSISEAVKGMQEKTELLVGHSRLSYLRTAGVASEAAHELSSHHPTNAPSGILSGLRRLISVLSDLRRELSELALAINLIDAARTLDELNDVRENRVLPITVRTLHLIEALKREGSHLKLEPTQVAVVELLKALSINFNAVLITLLGNGYNYERVDYSFNSGRGGYLEKTARVLELREMRKPLFDQVDEQLNLLLAIRTDLVTQRQSEINSLLVAVIDAWKWLLIIVLSVLIAYNLAVWWLGKYLWKNLLPLSEATMGFPTDKGSTSNNEDINDFDPLNRRDRCFAPSFWEKAQREVERQVAMRAQFFATMTTHIRTPVCGILGLTDLALDLASGNKSNLFEGKSYLKEMRHSARDILFLLNTCIDCARIESHQLTLEEVEVDLRRIMANLLQEFVAVARKKSVAVILSIAETIPDRFIGDPVRIGQVLHSIIDYNMKRRPKGGSIVIRIGPIAENFKYSTLQFSVVDSSSGSLERYRDELECLLTESDWQAFSSYSIGSVPLFASGKLVRLMHGRTWLESKDDKGTTVHFSIRLENLGAAELLDSSNIEGRALEDSSGMLTESSVVYAPEKGPLSKLQVLIIEEDELYLSLLVEFLSRMGFQVTTATGTSEGLSQLARSEVSLVIVDCSLSKMNAHVFVRTIRQAEIGTAVHVPIIGLTPSASRAERDQCLASGMDDYCPKPVTVLACRTIVLRNLRSEFYEEQ